MRLFVVVRGSKVTGMLTASTGTSNGLGVNLMSGDNRQRKRDGSFSPSYTLVVDSRTSKEGKIRVSSVPGPASHELISDVGEEIQHQLMHMRGEGGVIYALNTSSEPRDQDTTASVSAELLTIVPSRPIDVQDTGIIAPCQETKNLFSRRQHGPFTFSTPHLPTPPAPTHQHPQPAPPPAQKPHTPPP